MSAAKTAKNNAATHKADADTYVSDIQALIDEANSGGGGGGDGSGQSLDEWISSTSLTV